MYSQAAFIGFHLMHWLSKMSFRLLKVEGVCMVTRWAHHRGKTRALGTLGMAVLGLVSL
jgi:hypothetical protein